MGRAFPKGSLRDKLLLAGSVERPRSGLLAPAVPRPIRRLCKVGEFGGVVREEQKKEGQRIKISERFGS